MPGLCLARAAKRFRRLRSAKWKTLTYAGEYLSDFCLCATILYMTTLSVADARANFSRIVESAATTHERFEVTKNGGRAAVLLGADDYDSLIETVELLSDSESIEAIRVGIREVESGEFYDVENVRAAMRKAGRLAE
ncbi:MAG: relB [Subtercola sp.]|nr:relB [Subtercola sp.]